MSEMENFVKSPSSQRPRTEQPRGPVATARPPPSRRRDKPQLSCNACRKRKVRCDRLHPCIARGPAHVQDRINQLEGLVLGLMKQNTSNPRPGATTPNSVNNVGWPNDTHRDQSLDEGAKNPPPNASPSPSDYGNIRMRNSESSYVSSAHWAAVLDSISELRDHFEQEDEHSALTMHDAHACAGFPGPQLFYTGASSTISIDSILEAIPPRLVVDRLISRYFNDLDMASGVPHSGKFLREYEEFWKCPRKTPIIWIGLLFTMMCLSAQVQHHFLDSNSNADPQNQHSQTSTQTALFREKITHCLILGHYTKGGPHVLETLILYLMVEVFPSKDTASGLRILVSTIVTIATQMGYHRDASHFPNISPFAGEVRRRVWALIVQLDFNISMQMGLARFIKESQIDVSEPRNLFDSDFDEGCTELPSSRPETEVTPTLYTLTKVRLIVIGAKVADASTEPKPYSYHAVLGLDTQIDEVKTTLPPAMRWNGMACSLAVSAQILMKRIWIEICVHRLKIVLHKRFMLISESRETNSVQGEYSFSRNICLSAAMKILELQHLVDEETKPDGRLYKCRWRLTASFFHDFLLATSILCFYLQNNTGKFGIGVRETGSDLGTENNDLDLFKVKELLRTSQIIWRRESHSSQEARRAAFALHYILGDPETGPSHSGPTSTVMYFPGHFADMMSGCDFLADLDIQFPNEVLSWPQHI
ncbi:Fungal-specific transcription factor protein [Penicillium angulare]|uniref:Fungal-specific transcription factor protein n=1 Tax=Penicillium angulare TaxID=116970 RepID=UPI0025400469|nr:Fungal-specific transcription factor protein [Penicillium angulare]KAJ5291651.1 Fungal-specific transcription factor protein [Penicillium angulare]